MHYYEMIQTDTTYCQQKHTVNSEKTEIENIILILALLQKQETINMAGAISYCNRYIYKQGHLLRN